MRFPIPGKVKHCDEKVQNEVAFLRLLRKDGFPVPEIKFWGLSPHNRLGLGPYIIESYLDGIDVLDVLKDNQPSLGRHKSCRLMRTDVPDDILKRIYRQLAQFRLKLHRLSKELRFERIGGFSITPEQDSDEHDPVVNSRPFTLKANRLAIHSGVDVLGTLIP